MLKNTMVWGKKCECCNDCYILQNKFHPWSETDFVIKINCSKCGKTLEVTQKEAGKFYNEKIYANFRDVSGVVLDLGCGAGFLTQYLLSIKQVEKVYALDINKSQIGSFDKVTFIQDDLENINKHFEINSLDYLVHRDVFMFVSNPTLYFDDVSNIVKKGIFHMGWYVENNSRMLNQLTPDKIKLELEKRGWDVSLEYLDWYKFGYCIKAIKN